MSLHLILSKSGNECPQENTLPFINHAICAGFDGVYLKVQLGRNGDAYLFSEETTQGLCGTPGFFSYCDAACIEQLRVNGEAIPPLISALSHLHTHGNRPFMVHVHALHGGALSVIADALRNFNQKTPCGYLRFLLVCADAPAILSCKNRYPELSFALHMPVVPLSYAQDAATCRADAVYLPESFHSKVLIRDAKARNLDVYVEGAPGATHLARLVDLCVDGAAGSPQIKYSQCRP